MTETLLGADGTNDLGFGIQHDIEAPAIKVSKGLAQLRDPSTRRVTMVARILGRLHQFLNGNFGRRQIRVPEAEVDDILTASPGLDLERIDDGENVRWKTIDPAKIHHVNLLRRTPAPRHISQRRSRGCRPTRTSRGYRR